MIRALLQQIREIRERSRVLKELAAVLAEATSDLDKVVERASLREGRERRNLKGYIPDPSSRPVRPPPSGRKAPVWDPPPAPPPPSGPTGKTGDEYMEKQTASVLNAHRDEIMAHRAAIKAMAKLQAALAERVSNLEKAAVPATLEVRRHRWLCWPFGRRREVQHNTE